MRFHFALLRQNLAAVSPRDVLPVDDILPELKRVLGGQSCAVLQAPPGAGKTTHVPLALLDERWLGGKRVIMLEPRRIAARAAAQRMSRLRGEDVGSLVGYRVRGDSRVSRHTRIEVVTEGVLIRQLHADPALDGIGLVILDEFHERSLNSDVALALTLYSQELVRPDLRILVMSATLDGSRVAAVLGNAPMVQSEGHLFPVETRYDPPRPGTSPLTRVPEVVTRAVHEHRGDVLVFLPGTREIHDAARALAERTLPAGTYIVPLHGALTLEEQDRAIAASADRTRKIVLATSIAETSLTIEGVRVVVDGGLARVPRFSPATGMSRLQTVRVTRAGADQRRGRAGREAPGVCYRLWHAHETAELVPFQTPEILDADLAALALDLAIAGIGDPTELRWLDVPPATALAQARELLLELGAIDPASRATPHGRRMATLGAHPRLAHMMCAATDRGVGALGADLAALLDDRDIMRSGDTPPPCDIRLRLEGLRSPRSFPEIDARAVHRVRDVANRWRRDLGVVDGQDHSEWTGVLVALAYPDRIGLRRAGSTSRFALRGGGAALVREGDHLGAEPMLAIAATDGKRPEATVFLAAPIAEEVIRREFASDIRTHDVIVWDAERGEIRATRETRLGALVLESSHLSDPNPALVRAAMRSEIARRGLSILPWTDAAISFRQRLAFAHLLDPAWPSVADRVLIDGLDHWLGPRLEEVRRGADVNKIDLAEALASLLDWRQRATLDELAPSHLTVPTGSRIPVDYSDPTSPVLAVRLQEMFGASDTPRLFRGRVPVTLHLLSPAHRPVQVTQDLRGFWMSSYFDVRKDLRGRYPKHYWPDDPLAAEPTRRAKRPK